MASNQDLEGRGQALEGRAYYTKVVARLHNSKEVEVLTHANNPLPATNHLAREKYRSNLTYCGAHIPCHLCPHNTVYLLNIMTRAGPGRPL